MAYMLDASRQKELALAGVWGTLVLAWLTDGIAILAAGRHSEISLQLIVIFTCLSASPYPSSSTLLTNKSPACHICPRTVQELEMCASSRHRRARIPRDCTTLLLHAMRPSPPR